MMNALLTTAAKRALLISFGSIVFQQLSGCNAVILYSTSIFKVNKFIDITISRTQAFKNGKNCVKKIRKYANVNAILAIFT